MSIMEEKKYDVFISCKSEDYPLAKEVYDFLMYHGLTTFLASESLRKTGNTQYLAEIEDALEVCKHLVVFCTNPDYAKSRWVMEEWHMFRNEKLSGRKNGNILTIIADAIDIKSLPIGLRGYEVIKLSDYKKNILNYLKDSDSLKVVPTAGKVSIINIRPNDQCPCGSGKKFKNCHGKNLYV